MSEAARPLGLGDLRFERDDSASPERVAIDEDAIEARWTELCAQNPRLHDGRVLSLESFDQASGAGRVRVVPYRHLCVQPEVRTGVVQLSVTGLLEATVDGERAVLLARRAPGTRLYGSCWELAPSGGIDPPRDRDGARWVEFDGGHVLGQLLAEAHEELGVDLAGGAGVMGSARFVGVVRDAVACSADLVVALEIDAGAAGAPGSWEYSAVRWVRLSELGGFIRDVRNAGALVPTVEPALRLAGVLD